jgi:glyoxylase-like metal-dependent hydrolase (beta-lactamase superfamily II)
MNIVNVGYDSTNYYIVEAKSGKLLVDCGWPGTLPKFMAELKRKGISIKEIKHLLVTHFHPDHAGLAQELKNQGLKLIVLEPQTDFIPPFAEFFRGKNLPYVPITQHDNLPLKLEDSRKFLAGIGLDGEILHTPGHSDDSVTLILDEGYAFTGDLHPSFMNTDDAITRASWDKIHQHKITRIFPGHGGSATNY